MAKRKRSKLLFDKRRGVVVMQRVMLESDSYLSLSAQAKCLMILIQMHWTDFGPVAYSVVEAMRKIPCSKGTAMNAFLELQRQGFIEMVDESLFNSRLQSKSRTWRLTWMPYRSKAPTNDWEKKSNRSNSAPCDPPTGPDLHPPGSKELPQDQM